MTQPVCTLTVRSGEAVCRLDCAPGLSVREILDTTDLRVRAACGGTGSCGACTVRLIAGDANPLAVAEYQKLTAEERQQGMRLACQLRPRGDLEIALDHPAPPSRWKSIAPEDLQPAPGQLPDLASHIYGVAVDLGTTHIRVTLWDRKHGRRIASRRGPNPQGVFGADVLNRLAAAQASPDRARELAKLARTAIVQAVRDMCARDVGEVSPMLAEIGQVVLVGNTAMLALLTGRGAAELLQPACWQQRIDCSAPDPAWQDQWYLPNASILVPPPVAGFIGSDLRADLLATGLTGGPAPAMLLDVGTNTELVLWDGRQLHVTSVPGGPAFEGGGVRHGMPAESGAIWRVKAAKHGFDCQVIGGGEPRGICGSGLVDSIAALLAAGHLKPSGRFAVSPGDGGFRLLPDCEASAIAGSDVDAFQRAKAATAAAMEVLLARAGLSWAALRRLWVCGAFGHTLDIAAAQAVGLLPPLAADRVQLLADASLAGAERALLDPEGGGLLAGNDVELMAVNMSLVRGYDDVYIDHLRLRPIPIN